MWFFLISSCASLILILFLFSVERPQGRDIPADTREPAASATNEITEQGKWKQCK